MRSAWDYVAFACIGAIVCIYGLLGTIRSMERDMPARCTALCAADNQIYREYTVTDRRPWRWDGLCECLNITPALWACLNLTYAEYRWLTLPPHPPGLESVPAYGACGGTT